MLRLTHLTIIHNQSHATHHYYLRFHTSQHSLKIRCYNRGMRQRTQPFTITKDGRNHDSNKKALVQASDSAAKDAARMTSTSRSTATARSYSTLSDSTTYNARTTTHRTRSHLTDTRRSHGRTRPVSTIYD